MKTLFEIILCAIIVLAIFGCFIFITNPGNGRWFND